MGLDINNFDRSFKYKYFTYGAWFSICLHKKFREKSAKVYRLDVIMDAPNIIIF